MQRSFLSILRKRECLPTAILLPLYTLNPTKNKNTGKFFVVKDTTIDLNAQDTFQDSEVEIERGIVMNS